MCHKCARKIGKGELKLGMVKVLAHQIDSQKYACVPLFKNRADNQAVEGYFWLIRQAKTKRRYSRREDW